MIEFIGLDAKTGEFLDIPPKSADHTYLEALIRDRVVIGDAKLYTAKMYKGVIAEDLNRLKEQGIHLVLSNGGTAYFADAQTAEMLNSKMFQSFSDAVAYGSIPVSHANSSIIKTQGRVLVIDDEAKGGPDWGITPILRSDGTEVNIASVQKAANSLGDCYGLVSREMHGSLNARTIVEAANVPVAHISTIEALDRDDLNSAVMFEVAESLGLDGDLAKGFLNYKDENFKVQARRDGTTVVKWQITQIQADLTERSIEGKSLIESTVDGQSRITTLGGESKQQKEVNKQFNKVIKSYDTPFQFRAGVPEWQGVMKGTVRASELCRELGVDAIIPKSAIKGDDKTVDVGIHSVESLYWARKSDAADRQQKLGAQVLVNLPEGTRVDVMPKLKEKAETLAQAQNDPRLLAALYIAKYEKRAQIIEAQTPESASIDEDEFAIAEERIDWLYEVLKADARPTSVIVGINPTNVGVETPNVDLSVVMSPDSYAQLNEIAEAGLEPEAFLEQANPLLIESRLEPWTPETLEAQTITGVRGGYGQMLEHEKVVYGLQKFAKAEWEDAALGGVYVPSSMAQPHSSLRQSDPANGVLGEICAPVLPHGAKVAIYRSPVANVAAFRVFENNLEGIKQGDREAFRQSGVVYLNPNDAKELVIDFDGDTVAMIPEEGFERIHQEITELNAPDRKPVQVEKEKKIPRNANDPSIASLPPEEQEMAKRFTSIEIAAIDAADNPTGSVSNTLMRLEALRWETQYVFDRATATAQLQGKGVSPEQMPQLLTEREVEIKREYLQTISDHFRTINALMSGKDKPMLVPPTTKDGYDFRASIVEIAQSNRAITAFDPEKQLVQIDAQLGKVEKFLFQTEGIAAVNLQRAVDTPKSARVVNQQEFAFCKMAANYKEVEWVKHKRDSDLFLNGKEMPTNTQDPVGWMASQANQLFEETELDQQRSRAHNTLFDKMAFTPKQAEVAKEVVQEYNSAIATSLRMEERATTESGPALVITTTEGQSIEATNLTVFDPKGESPIWAAAREGQSVSIQLVPNEKLNVGESYRTEKTHGFAVIATVEGMPSRSIGTLSEQSREQLAIAQLQREDPKRLAEFKKQFAENPKGLSKALKEVDVALIGNASGTTDFFRLSGTMKLAAQHDPEDAKALRVAAQEKLAAWVETVQSEDRESWAAALWHNGGQKIAMMALPEQVQSQLASPQLTQTTISGMEFSQTNECYDRDWTLEPSVEVRVAVGTQQAHYDPRNQEDHPHYGKTVLQVKDADGAWKTIAPMSANGEHYQLPIGTVATASITTVPGNNLVAVTRQGTRLTIKPIGNPDLPLNGEPLKVQFVSEGEGRSRKSYITAVGNPSQKLAQLNQTADRDLRAIEKGTGKAIFNAPNIMRAVRLEAEPVRSAQVKFDPSTIKMPERWTKRNPEAWEATLKDMSSPIIAVSQAVSEVQHQTNRSRIDQPSSQLAQENQPAVAEPSPSLAAPELTPTQRKFQVKYDQMREAAVALFEGLGANNISDEQIDLQIAQMIRANTLESQAPETVILARSPVTQAIKNREGIPAAQAYCNHIWQTSIPQRVQQPKREVSDREAPKPKRRGISMR